LVINDGRLPNRDAGTISFWVKPEGNPFSNAEEGDNGDEQMIVYLTPNDEGRGNGFGEDPEMHMHRMSNRDEEGNITDERVDWYTRSDGDDINEEIDEVYIFNSDRDEAQAFATSHEWSSLTRHESCIP